MTGTKRLAAILLVCIFPPRLAAVETTFWRVGTFDEFLEGTLTGLSVTKEGELKLAPEARAVFNPDEPLALSLASDRNHNLYVGTGHQGKVFRIDKNFKSSLLFTAHEPDIFALAASPDGSLYVGSSPEGKIYQVSPEGKSKVFFEPKTKYIWSLALDAQGRLYAGTGDRGQIFRIDPSGKGEVFFESKQTHIMCLAPDRQGNLLAGSAPNGLIYRVSPQGKAFILYQTGLPEIHDLVTDSEGRIYAAALGSAAGKGTPEFFVAPSLTGPEQRVTTTVTVTGTDEASSGAAKAQNPPLAPSGPSAVNRQGPQSFGIGVPQGVQGRGSLIEILPDSTVETVWSSNNESIFGLALRGNHVLFSTDSDGRIFDLDPSRNGRKLTLLVETHESLATRLLFVGPDLFVATTSAARIFHIDSGPTREGNYDSPVKDTRFISRWGVLSWRGDTLKGAKLEFFSRSGNSDRPDPTWSDWAGPYANADGSRILSPSARYFQWRAVFHGSGEATPALDEVTVSYLNQNLSPQIHSLSVSSGGERTSPTVATTSPSSSGASVTVSMSPSTSFGAPPGPGGAAKNPVIFNWQADDPNGDQLIYALYIRAADETEWHLLKEKLRQPSFQLEPNTLADGKYVALLVASDEESNPPGTARKTEMMSAPFWMDNTPPQIQVLKQVETADGLEVQFRVEDATSPLRSAEASIDGRDWKDTYSDDGIVDSRVETFTVRTSNLDPGEHIVTLRAYDTAGNVGVGKAVVRVSGGSGQHR